MPENHKRDKVDVENYNTEDAVIEDEDYEEEEEETDLKEVMDEVKEEVLKKLPNDKAREIVSQSMSISKSGPLPDPEDFAKYEETLIGAGERIFTMTEKEQDHRHDIDRKEQEKFHKNNTMLSMAGIIVGGLISLTGIVGGIFLAILENAFAGAFISTISLGSIVANILKAGNKQNID